MTSEFGASLGKNENVIRGLTRKSVARCRFSCEIMMRAEHEIVMRAEHEIGTHHDAC